MKITCKVYVKRIAETSIGVSTLRGHPKGTVLAARKYLGKLDLTEFQCSTPSEFNEILQKHTLRLSRKIQQLDSRFAYWGSARKALNIFLENATYHAILRKEYLLDDVEKYLEVPLDSQVANELILEAQKRKAFLPKWTTIKGLLPESSQSYQSFANLYAKELGCSRVQLDLLLWRK